MATKKAQAQGSQQNDQSAPKSTQAMGDEYRAWQDQMRQEMEFYRQDFAQQMAEFRKETEAARKSVLENLAQLHSNQPTQGPQQQHHQAPPMPLQQKVQMAFGRYYAANEIIYILQEFVQGLPVNPQSVMTNPEAIYDAILRGAQRAATEGQGR